MQSIRFTDGTIWDAAYIQGRLYPATEGNDVIYGTNDSETLSGLGGNDQLYGGRGDDTLVGGAGNDVLRGNEGDDTCLFGRESGNDYLYLTGGGTDTILLDSGIGPEDIILWRYNYLDYDGYTHLITDDLMLSIGTIPSVSPTTADRVLSTVNGEEIIAGSTDSVMVHDWFKYPNAQIRFADGTIWTSEQIYNWYLQGGAGDDWISGRSTDDSIGGGDGDDYLYGRSGNDVISGGRGMDWLYGDDGNDILDGGADADRLFGGEGSDTYVLRRGQGYDMISDYDPGSDDTDTISVSADISPEDVTLKRKYNDLEVRISGTEDYMEISHYFEGPGRYRIERIQFADGTVWDVDTINQKAPQVTEEDDWIMGTESADTLLGLGGNDHIAGLGGNDTIDGGAGDDWLWGGDGDDSYLFGRGSGHDSIESSGEEADGHDTVLLGDGISPADVSLTRDGDNLLLSVSGSGDTLNAGWWFRNTEVFNVDAIRFADGTVWDADTIRDMMSFQGTDGNDILEGDAADNKIRGRAGNDTLYGHEGDDFLDGGAGNDTMLGGLGDDTYVVDATGDIVTENAGEGTDTVRSSIGYTLGDHIENLTLTGSGHVDGTGNILGNVLTGNDGNNTLSGGAGADTMIGGIGSDTYVVDDAGDIVTENAGEGTDTVRSFVTYALGANVENLTLTGSGAISGTGNVLANVLTGNSAANSLTGGAGDDRMDGAEGDDLLDGGSGDDTYLFGRGYGRDVICDYDESLGNTDTVSFGGGIAPSDIRLTRRDDNLILSINGTDDELSVYRWFNGTGMWRVERIRLPTGRSGTWIRSCR